MDSQQPLFVIEEMDASSRKEPPMTATDNTKKTDAINAINANARILAQDIVQSNDTQLTGLNNNDLIIGSTGAGKTRGYVIPMLIHDSGESLIVADTKGNLHRKYGEHLRDQGYDVQVVDFVDCLHSPTGYDPMRFVGRNEMTGKLSEQDIVRLAAAICPVQTRRDPYWEQSAQMFLKALIALTFERFVKKDQSMKTVCYLASILQDSRIADLFSQLEIFDPNSFALRQYRMATINQDAKTTIGCIMGMLVNALQAMSFDGASHFFTAKNQVDFASLGRKKTALFLTISDNDRSLDRLLNIFYAQALQELIRTADREEDDALQIPVRLILDDFASNAVIPDFDKIITTIRSRNIAVSLIVQDLTQLFSMYGRDVGTTIANNCDTWLYLGGQDVETAEMLSRKLSKPTDAVLALGLDEVFLFRRGSKPQQVKKYDLTSDPVHNAILAGEREDRAIDVSEDFFEEADLLFEEWDDLDVPFPV